MHEHDEPHVHASLVLEATRLGELVGVLAAAGYQVIGPTIKDGAVAYEPIESADELARGTIDHQDGGRYRLESDPKGAYFSHVVGPHSWKRYLWPSEQRLWRAERSGRGFKVTEGQPDSPAYAFLGVRACELAAIAVQDRVFDNGDFADPAYLKRRKDSITVAVNCTRAGGTCFCTSMGTGPQATQGFDIALTEMRHEDEHLFLLEVGGPKGAAIVEELGGRTATEAEIARARGLVEQAAASMGREMIDDAAAILMANLDHPRWDEVATRCLNCANCTMVCPTCFCSSVEDTTSLTGDVAERWRRWESCFGVDFSYIHGGAIRKSGRSRYRQWMTHKLSSWHQQFGTSGCVGCGRCITWCPVGIDITEEARAIRDNVSGSAI